MISGTVPTITVENLWPESRERIIRSIPPLQLRVVHCSQAAHRTPPSSESRDDSLGAISNASCDVA